jgi:drug/metabolite transporter (DMT)-like permease
MKNCRENNRSTLAGMMAILLWSSTVALARRLAEQVGPLTAGSSVFLSASMVLAVPWAGKRPSLMKLRELPRKFLIGCGMLFVVYSISLFLAVGLANNRHQTVEIGLLNYLWPSLTLLFSLFLLGNRANIGLIPGTGLALVGVFLVLTQAGSVTWNSFSVNFMRNPTAYGLGILAAVVWGLYSNLSRRWGTSESGGAVLLFTLSTGLAFGLIRILLVEPGSWTPRAVAELTVLALATAMAYLFWDLAMRKGDMVLVVSCSYLTPFLSSVVSCLYLGVLPGRNLWLGCFCIVAGSFLSWHSIWRVEALNDH